QLIERQPLRAAKKLKEGTEHEGSDRLVCRLEIHIDSHSQKLGNPSQHAQRMPLVVSVFQPADHGLGRLDLFGKLLLAEPSSGSELEDLARNLGVKAFLFERSLACWIIADIAPPKDRHCIGGTFLGAHGLFSSQ